MNDKENQFALDVVAHALPFGNYICEIHTLQQAIDERELYKKAFEIVIETATSPMFHYDDEIDLEKYSLKKAKKELKVKKNDSRNRICI